LASLYNESHLYFTILTIVLIPVIGLVFGVLADLIMSISASISNPGNWRSTDNNGSSLIAARGGSYGLVVCSHALAGVKIFWPGLIILGIGVGIIGGFFGMGGAWMVTPGLNILGFPWHLPSVRTSPTWRANR